MASYALPMRTSANRRGGGQMATLVSVNVGKPQDVAWRGRTVHTGVWKTPVTGPQHGAPPEPRR